MKKLNTLLVAGMLLTTTVANAQKWNKDISFLKGQTELNLQYTYDGLRVGKEGSEADYIEKKKTDYAKKDPAKAEQFEQNWKSAPSRAYAPKFEALFNKIADGKIHAAQNLTSAKYTLIVNTTYIEPGYNIGITRQPAYCNFEMKLVETENPSNVLSTAILMNIIGQDVGGFDFDTSARISESYAKAGKMTSGSILKVIKK